MKSYIHMGSQPLEFPGVCRVEPSAEGTQFSAELDPDVERRLLALGVIVLASAPAESEAPKSARKGGR
jgi:hypothetical protein